MWSVFRDDLQKYGTQGYNIQCTIMHDVQNEYISPQTSLCSGMNITKPQALSHERGSPSFMLLLKVMIVPSIRLFKCIFDLYVLPFPYFYVRSNLPVSCKLQANCVAAQLRFCMCDIFRAFEMQSSRTECAVQRFHFTAAQQKASLLISNSYQ